MRNLIIFALVGFLAITIVQARPAEEEETSVSQFPAIEEGEADTEEEDNETDAENDNAEDEDNDDEEEPVSTTEASKPKKVFWPIFGGHGPVVIRPHVRTLA